MPLVIKPAAFACRAERLAGTRTCPDWTVVGPSGSAQGVGPDADAGKEMALGETGEFVGSDIFD
jgi:pyridoxal biosynthesis lyase PdxS